MRAECGAFGFEGFSQGRAAQLLAMSCCAPQLACLGASAGKNIEVEERLRDLLEFRRHSMGFSGYSLAVSINLRAMSCWTLDATSFSASAGKNSQCLSGLVDSSFLVSFHRVLGVFCACAQAFAQH